MLILPTRRWLLVHQKMSHFPPKLTFGGGREGSKILIANLYRVVLRSLGIDRRMSMAQDGGL